MDTAPTKKDLQSNGEGGVSTHVPRQTEQQQRWAAQQERHKAVITAVLNKTTRIRKESKSRRHRDLQGTLLDDAVDALTKFQDVEWPPREPNAFLAPALPEWMKVEETSSCDDLQMLMSDGKADNSTVPQTDREAMTKHENGDNKEVQEESGDGDDKTTIEANTTDTAAATVDAAKSAASLAAFEKQRSAAKLPSVSPRSNSGPTDSVYTAAVQKVKNLLDQRTQSQKQEPMHSAVIASLEAYCLVMRSLSKTPKMCETVLECVILFATNGYVSGEAGIKDKQKETEITPEKVNNKNKKKVESEEAPLTMLDYIVESICKCSESTSEFVHVAMAKALISLIASRKCGVHEAALLVSVRSTFHVYLVSKPPNVKDVARATLLDMLKVVFSRMESYDAVARSNLRRMLELAKKNNTINGDALDDQQLESHDLANAFSSQYHTDAYLLFRALCKLSAKTLPEEDPKSKLSIPFTITTVVDPLALNSKVLSLELILAVFENCGEAFRHCDKFIYAVQNYLCVSLLKNCMSVHTDVAYLSLKLFIVLMYNFKTHLKSEIEVFIANIFLRVLESPNASFDQKALVLEALRTLCSDPVMLTQLFLNYDCDFDAVDLYKSIVWNLSRVSTKPRMPSSYPFAAQDAALIQTGLEVLVVILRAFLKVLNLQGGDDEIDDSTSFLRSKSNIHLDIAMAVTGDKARRKNDGAESASDSGDESSMYAQELRSICEKQGNSEGMAVKIVDAFDRKRAVQQNFENGVIKFTLSLKGGLLFFIENGFLTLDAREVALFLQKHEDRLDKTQIGEVLGKEPDASFVKDKNIDPEAGGEGFFVRVLHHYVYGLDFTGMAFDEAIRSFLSGFRLPGEAQKIDRIMEKFAELYTRQNADVFASADTAFILAFSVIMLNTDLHNPSIKPEKRMTVESFIRNNRGISVDGGDLPDAFLEGIFRRIESKPFTLKEDDDAREKEKKVSMRDTFFALQERNFFGTSAEERKREKFKKEQEEIMSASEQLFKSRPKGRGKMQLGDDKSQHSQLTEFVSPVDVVKPMFDVTWGPLIGTLSHILETSDDNGVIKLCLNGFVYSVRIAAHSNMSLARETFVNALTKFTTLGSIKEMKFKNIESIQTLLSIAIMDGEYLGESWGAVLQCISHLGRLQNMGIGGVDDERFFIGAEENGSRDENKSLFRLQSSRDVERETETQNAQAVLAAVNEILIDKVFSSTVNLSAPSMAQFVEQLINVSAAEISGDLKKGMGVQGRSATPNSGLPLSNHSSRNGQGPRIFSLQKLVEVADYNMDARPRIAWTQMWELMARHFAAIGCHKNAMVSMYAIDALRQLSFKFLQKPELYDFNFQRVFLRPFLLIMENPISRQDIRELILRCVDNMIRTLSCNLRSGWKIFFQIITLSAVDPCEKNSTLGLAILQRLLDEHLEQLCHRYAIDEYSSDYSGEQLAPEAMTVVQRRVRNANAEDFVDLCHASLSFVETEAVKNPLPVGLSMRALCHTACYADLIADQKVLPPVISQAVDPEGACYTYEGLTIGESEEMVLWKPIFDGLAAGIASKSICSSGGLGCLVQRGSAITLRAILLRHGGRFSMSQWNVILKHVILPSIQSAAESDQSPVSYITSESPSVSSLDFVADSLPLPPPPNAEGLIKFAAKAQSDECAPKRPLGPAELLVEASFADLRHGGDGDLTRIPGFPQRSSSKTHASEQPFPESWVATTASLALGILADIFSEFAFTLGDEGRTALWPSIFGQYKLWILGPPDLLDDNKDSDDISILEDIHTDPLWRPCEALARIGCKELSRIPAILSKRVENLNQAMPWWEIICGDFSSVLLQNVALNRAILTELIDSKLAMIGRHKLSETPSKNLTSKVNTPYGLGEVLKRRRDIFEHQIWEVSLDWGATLYGPEPEDFGKEDDTSYEVDTDDDNLSVEDDEDSVAQLVAKKHQPSSASLTNMLERYVPALKIRCVVAHVLQQYIASSASLFVECTNDVDVRSLLSALDASRIMALEANQNVDIAHAFKEFVRREWGDSVEEVEAALAAANSSRDLNQGKNEVFFLGQEAGANRAMIQLLSRLHLGKHDQAFESILFERIADILTKYLRSEENDKHLVDPNVWHKPCESCVDIPLYCTSFANVVASILRTVLQFSEDQFRGRKQELYSFLCELIKVQSTEIRGLVSEVFAKKVAPLLEVDMKHLS